MDYNLWCKGCTFTTAYINVFGDSITNLYEDMVAEQVTLVTYYQLINLTDDVDIINVLRFLAEREIVHYQRFERFWWMFMTMVIAKSI